METTYTHGKKTIDFINKQMDKKGLNNLLSQMYLEFGGAKTAELANSLKNLGYKYATKSGTTISIADLQVPAVKKELLNEAEKEIEKFGGIDLFLGGIGPDGHIAFNDPPDAHFDDPQLVRRVKLSEKSRVQQVHDGCFEILEDYTCLTTARITQTRKS